MKYFNAQEVKLLRFLHAVINEIVGLIIPI